MDTFPYYDDYISVTYYLHENILYTFPSYSFNNKLESSKVYSKTNKKWL